MNTFFICSLPRSRTAWLANFLCYGPCHCFHEPFAEYRPLALPGLFASTGKAHVGISDCTNTLFLGALLQMFPSARLVLIRRPPKEVAQRLLELGWPCGDFIFRLDAELDKIEQNYKPLVINYYAFDAPAIWAYLMPEVPLDGERTKMLETFNVTVPKMIIERKAREFIKKYMSAQAEE
jgi:hypothetical protein